ncbi:MAG TPA: hypothetical protein VMD75_13115 [Candidatus Binataceae bacterium]|nr:hypothetical protein [Candidatus Binataceae bacterium]
MDIASDAGQERANPVIYLALALPLLLGVIAISNTLTGRYSHPVAEPRAITAPGHTSGEPNPANLIRPQNVRYVG